MPTDLRDYLELPYAELEELNLAAKRQRSARVPMEQLQAERLKP
jgi:glutamine synthetase